MLMKLSFGQFVFLEIFLILFASYVLAKITCKRYPFAHSPIPPFPPLRRQEIKNGYFENGMTVAQLKELIYNWPETDEDGNACEVWLKDDRNLSNVATGLLPLNVGISEDGNKKWADLLISHSK